MFKYKSKTGDTVSTNIASVFKNQNGSYSTEAVLSNGEIVSIFVTQGSMVNGKERMVLTIKPKQ